MDPTPQLRHAVGGSRRGVQEREIKGTAALLAEADRIGHVGIDRHADIRIRHREEIAEMLDALVMLHVDIAKAHKDSFRRRGRSRARAAGFSTRYVSAAARTNAAAKQRSVYRICHTRPSDICGISDVYAGM